MASVNDTSLTRSEDGYDRSIMKCPGFNMVKKLVKKINLRGMYRLVSVNVAGVARLVAVAEKANYM